MVVVEVLWANETERKADKTESLANLGIAIFGQAESSGNSETAILDQAESSYIAILGRAKSSVSTIFGKAESL